MKLMTCPLNGPRNISEFVCLGDVKPRPAPDAPGEEWADYAFLHENVAGRVVEWWMHGPSAYCFIAVRDTLSGEILETHAPEGYFADERAAP